MSMHKAIKSGKEHRVEYGTKNQPYCKAVDSRCRNHGSCPWCYDNRTKKYRNLDKVSKQELRDFQKNKSTLVDFL